MSEMKYDTTIVYTIDVCASALVPVYVFLLLQFLGKVALVVKMSLDMSMSTIFFFIGLCKFYMVTSALKKAGCTIVHKLVFVLRVIRCLSQHLEMFLRYVHVHIVFAGGWSRYSSR